MWPTSRIEVRQSQSGTGPHLFRRSRPGTDASDSMPGPLFFKSATFEGVSLKRSLSPVLRRDASARFRKVPSHCLVDSETAIRPDWMVNATAEKHRLSRSQMHLIFSGGVSQSFFLNRDNVYLPKTEYRAGIRDKSLMTMEISRTVYDGNFVADYRAFRAAISATRRGSRPFAVVERCCFG